MSGQKPFDQGGEGSFGGQSTSGDNRRDSDTLTSDRDDDQRSTGQSTDKPSDEGFIGSQSGSEVTGGQDFAKQGRGALDKEDANEDDSGSSGSTSGGSGI